MSCVTSRSAGKFHTFCKYETLFLKRIKYKCLWCKTTINEKEYQKYLEEKKEYYKQMRGSL